MLLGKFITLIVFTQCLKTWARIPTRSVLITRVFSPLLYNHFDGDAYGGSRVSYDYDDEVNIDRYRYKSATASSAAAAATTTTTTPTTTTTTPTITNTNAITITTSYPEAPESVPASALDTPLFMAVEARVQGEV